MIGVPRERADALDRHRWRHRRVRRRGPPQRGRVERGRAASRVGPITARARCPTAAAPTSTTPARLVPDLMVVRRRGGEPEPYAQGFGLGGSTLVHGAVATPDPGQFEFDHLMPLEEPQRLGTLGAAVLDVDPRTRPVLLARRDGQRVSAADAYLRPALHRPNLFVVTGSSVVRLGLQGWKVDRAITDDGIEYRADRFVVCAGSDRHPGAAAPQQPRHAGHRRGHPGPPGVHDRARSRTGHRCVGADGVGADRPQRQPDPAAQPPAPRARSRRADRRPARREQPGPRVAARIATARRWSSSISSPRRPTSPGSPMWCSTPCGSLDLEALEPVIRRAYLDADGTPASSLGDDPDLVREWAVTHITGLQPPVVVVPRGRRRRPVRPRARLRQPAHLRCVAVPDGRRSATRSCRSSSSPSGSSSRWRRYGI